MTVKEKSPAIKFFEFDREKWVNDLGDEIILSALDKMLLIRNFETRAESAYQQGHIGGFFHSYAGQEAIQVAAIDVFGKDHWFATTYRCHALALLLGVTPNELMAELFGKATGNAKGRGGSMHLYTDRLLGGFGIVGGHVPVAAGAALTLKYNNEKEKVSFCFLGDGGVAQGAFHEAINIAALWDLPLITVIENNYWGMGTAVERAISVERIAEEKATGYGIKGYTIDGMDYFNCVAAFTHIFEEVKRTSRPVLVEAVTQRFRGHSISDPGLYRSKEDLKQVMEGDPISILKVELMKRGILTEASFKEKEKHFRTLSQEAIKYADASPWPDPVTLEEDVLAPEKN